MNTLIKIVCLVIFNVGFSFGQTENIHDVTVNISNLKSDNGNVYISIYNSETSFLNQGFKAALSKIENNSCTIIFEDIPNGIYAISFFHDENENKKMDSNFLGIPKEDYGCSNNSKGFMGPPKWEDAKFEINNKSITQNIKL